VATPELDAILDQLRASGGRITTARRAVIAALVETDAHVTADDVAERVQASHPDVHQSTIYRILDDLEELGLVDHVHLGHGRAVYHLAGNAHQHLVCETCSAVIEVPASVFAPLARKLRADFGFDLHATHFAVTGRCSTCVSVASGSQREGRG
jgi:Fur family ferric uptake transcriptional regulator